MACNDLEMRQFDIKAALLHGKLEETIYMKYGVCMKYGGPNMVCKLNKSSYDLKQAPRCWNITFTTFLKKFGFRSSIANNSLYVTKINNCKVLLLLFVDDRLLIAKDKCIVNNIISEMRNGIKIVVTEPNKFAGMYIVRDRSKYELCIYQKDYIDSFIERFGMND